MLKAKAIERFLAQVLDEPAGITGVMLFNKEGMALARAGSTFANGNVYAALLSNVWETYEQQQTGRNPMREMVVAGEEGTVLVEKVAPTMLLAIITDERKGSCGGGKATATSTSTTTVTPPPPSTEGGEADDENEGGGGAEKGGVGGGGRVPLAVLKARLHALAEHLKEPLSSLM